MNVNKTPLVSVNSIAMVDTDGDGIFDDVDIDDDNDGVLDFDECNLFANTNAGFELPNITQSPYNSTTWQLVNQANTSGWSTTATDGLIEFWRSGFNGVPSAEGSQFVEINATQVSTLYQNFPLNGSAGVINWSIKHRGRSGVDVAAVKMGPSLATVTTVATMSDGNTAWGTYTGTYNVAAGQTNLTIAFSAISSVGGISFGNFLDDVKFAFYENCDFDNDGIPNHLDLDSDGDGCPDSDEAGVTAYITANSGISSTGNMQNGNNTGTVTSTVPISAAIAGPGTANAAAYGSNGFYNLLETNDTSSAKYKGVYTYTNALNFAINNCACYSNASASTGSATKHGITLLSRAGVNSNNWPMIRNSAHTVLESNTKGFVVTRFTTAQITALASPQEGMMVFDTDSKCLKIFDGTIWSCLSKPSCP